MLEFVEKRVINNMVVYHFRDEAKMKKFQKERVEPNFKPFISKNLGIPFIGK